MFVFGRDNGQSTISTYGVLIHRGWNPRINRLHLRAISAGSAFLGKIAVEFCGYRRVCWFPFFVYIHSPLSFYGLCTLFDPRTDFFRSTPLPSFSPL